MAKMSFAKALNASTASKSTPKTPRAKREVDAVAAASIAPKLERAKLKTPEHINREIGKQYRRFSNKQISSAELKSRVTTLTALRSGMAEVESNGDFEPATFHIFSVPENHFLSGEQIEAMQNGQSIVDISQFQPLQIAPPVVEVVVEPVAQTPPESYRDMLLRRAHEDEAKGRSWIMRAPRADVRWPKPGSVE